MDFFTSDLHINHDKILGYCNRPFSSVEEMNEALIINWNETVNTEDTVYILGDFLMGQRTRTKEFADRLNGYKILILGNHDNEEECRKVFPEVYKYLMYSTADEDYLLVHDPAYAKIYLELDPMFEDVDTVLHGHVHTSYIEECTLTCNQIIRYINVGVDVRDFRPQVLDQLLQTNEKEKKSQDV